jgi:8-oxo-dGTP pyrophosphatase MutT (NUDIX family)
MAGEKSKKDKFYAGGFLYNPKLNAVLLHKRDAKAKVNPNSWAFFGGLNEDQETPKQTFKRELQEELNITIPENKIKPLCDYFNNELQTYRYVFFVESDLPKEQMNLSEGEDFDWIPLDKVFEYVLTEKSIKDLKLFLKLQKK